MNAGVDARARGGCVIQRCQNKNPRYQGRWMTSCTGSVRGGFGGFEKSQLVEFLRPNRKVVFRGSPRPCGGCHTWFGADGKVSIERWYLSPYVEKPLNSKVIKSFVPELRSRKCFSCFGIPMLSIYELWTYYVYFTYSCMGMLHWFIWYRDQDYNPPHICWKIKVLFIVYFCYGPIYQPLRSGRIWHKVNF